MRASEFIAERKKKKSSRSTGGYFFPGYGYYGSDSGEGGGDGGGESVDRGMAEGATVTRIDSKPVTDFASGLKAYKHTDNWSQSGLDTGDDSYWKNKNLKTNTTKGLFAGDPRRTALYATGNAHETRYVEFTQNGQPIVYFDQKDLPAMRSRKTYLTVFDARNFRQLPTGEWFSENPGKPIKQVPIGDPFKYIASQGWIVRVTDDLDKVFKQVKNMHKAGKIAQYGAEGMNESQQGVAEGLAQDEAEEEYGGWRAEFVDEINYNTFEVRVENVRARESANFIIRPVDMVSYGPTLAIETMDVHDLQTGQTESWTNDDPAPEGPIAFAISALFYDDKQLQKKLNNIIDTHNNKGQDMMPGLDQRRSIGQEVDSDSYIDSSEKTQAAMAKMKQGMAENFADGRNPQDKGDAKRHGINTKASVSSLRKTAKQGGRKGQLAHWLANMKSGRAKKK